MNYTDYIKQYYQQSHRLPRELKQAVHLKTNEEVFFYAHYDLDENFKFVNGWVILTDSYLVQAVGNEIKHTISFNEIVKVVEVSATSCTSISLIKADDLPALATLRFTHRQKVNLSQLKYLVEGKIEKNNKIHNFDPDEQYAQALLQNLLKKQSGKTRTKSKVVWRLISYLKPYKKEVAIGAFGAVMTTVVSLIPAYLSGQMIDQVVKPFQDGKLDQSEAIQMATILLASLASVYVIRKFFIWLRLLKLSVMGEKVARDLREQLYAHLQKLGLDFFSSKQTGSIISRVSSDTDRIWDFVAFGVVETAISMLMLVGLSIMLISLDWKLGLLMISPLPIILWSIFSHGERMKRMFLRAWRKWSDLTDVLSDTIPGIQVVKAFNQGNRETKRFIKKNKVVNDEFNNIHNVWTKFWPLLLMSIYTIILAVWFFAIPRLLSSPTSANHLSAGTFVSFLLYMTMFVQPIDVIGQVARMLNRATSSAFRIFEILDTEPSFKQKDDAQKLSNLKGDIEFKNVIFSYDGIRQIIKGMNFKIKAGEMIGLVGPSGGGKSTITKLISRFYDINSGSITIDGVDIRNLDIGHLRSQVGMVLQDPYLFHGTIADNISYGMPDASLGKIIKAAKVANAHEFILKLTDGYNTIVGERGQTLSGGERQRISIARAILHNPKILILDEATSAVDTKTERNIQQALDRLVEGRTVIAIAHRLSTLRKADRIFAIKEGKLVENGTHSELMQVDGEYKKLQDMQTEMYQLQHGEGLTTEEKTLN